MHPQRVNRNFIEQLRLVTDSRSLSAHTGLSFSLGSRCAAPLEASAKHGRREKTCASFDPTAQTEVAGSRDGSV